MDQQFTNTQPEESAAETAGEQSLAPQEKPAQESVQPPAESSGTTPSEQEEEPAMPPLTLPQPQYDFDNGIGVFAYSLIGQSHIEMKTVCQDRCGFRFLKDIGIVVSAVADGVGSCELSEYGASCAVETALDYVRQALYARPDIHAPLDNAYMGQMLRGMMKEAYDSVIRKSQELQVLLYSLQSTLTVAVYDGTDLFFAHAGDDGIVVLKKDGTYAMATTRHKGDEASSVYPLQSTNTWQFGKVTEVSAFAMATDGVLDAFVMSEFEENRIYEPFIDSILTAAYTDTEGVKAVCEDYYQYMQTPSYRSAVRDDLTLVGVSNVPMLQQSQKPVFDKEEWNRRSAEYAAKRKQALYAPLEESQPQQTTPVSAQTQATATAQTQPQPKAASPVQPQPKVTAPTQSQPKAASYTPPPHTAAAQGKPASAAPHRTQYPSSSFRETAEEGNQAIYRRREADRDMEQAAYHIICYGTGHLQDVAFELADMVNKMISFSQFPYFFDDDI